MLKLLLNNPNPSIVSKLNVSYLNCCGIEFFQRECIKKLSSETRKLGTGKC